MRIVWDQAKLEANLRKHGLDFADAEQVFYEQRDAHHLDAKGYPA